MICKLFIKPVKGQPPTEADAVTLVADRGVEGDCHAQGGDRAVCLVTKSTAEKIEKIRDSYVCAAKFSPNIILSEDRSFRVGDVIRVGSAEITVTAVGRECHQLCALPDCPLIDGIIFAAVTGGGEIKTGDAEDYA